MIYKKYIKRIIDIIVSLIGLPFFLLIIIVFAPIILITDRSHVFYSASRLGKNGKVFKMFKFRSMSVYAPDIRNADGSTYNGNDDPRVTKIGQFMRKCSIDETPQLINVLIGDMSIIGPRPNLVTGAYDELPQIQKDRTKMRPGITGYNQAYFRNSVSTEQKFVNDVYYVENATFLFDLKIIIKTILTVIKKENIYIEKPENVSSEHDKKLRCINNNMKRLLIIGASILQLPAIKRAKELGYYVGVADYNPKAVGIQYADEYFNVSTIDIDGVVKTAESFKPDGIMTLATDMPVRSIAAACKKLGLAGISPDTAVKSTDKGEMMKAFEANGVEHPWFHIADTEDEFIKLLNEVSFPCIIKPTDNSGSRGVVLAKNVNELKAAYDYSKEQSRSGAVIVEEYMKGSEVSVEIIVTDGEPHVLAVTDKITTGEPHFVEMGHSQPSVLAENDLVKIRDLACRAIKAVGINCGPAHVEVMLTLDGPKMVELGARMGGDCITTHLVPLSTGIDMVEATIRIACGEKPDITPKFQKGSAIRYFNVPQGRINSSVGAEEAKMFHGISEITFTKVHGDQFCDISSSTDRVGFVISQAECAVKAIEICNKVTEKVNYQFID